MPFRSNPLSSKFWTSINKYKKVGLKLFNNAKVFIEYSNDMQGVYKNIDEYNQGKKHKILIFFDDMIADMINNKN